jgi:hypothetical protein
MVRLSGPHEARQHVRQGCRPHARLWALFTSASLHGSTRSVICSEAISPEAPSGSALGVECCFGGEAQKSSRTPGTSWLCRDRRHRRARNICAMVQEAASDADHTNDADVANAIRKCCPVHQGQGRAQTGLGSTCNTDLRQSTAHWDHITSRGSRYMYEMILDRRCLTITMGISGHLTSSEQSRLCLRLLATLP